MMMNLREIGKDEEDDRTRHSGYGGLQFRDPRTTTTMSYGGETSVRP
jgi:hypothetical protein